MCYVCAGTRSDPIRFLGLSGDCRSNAGERILPSAKASAPSSQVAAMDGAHSPDPDMLTPEELVNLRRASDEIAEYAMKAFAHLRPKAGRPPEER